MIKMRKIKAMALVLSALIVLCSCTSGQEVPELLEPVGAEPTFRPVEKADMEMPRLSLALLWKWNTAIFMRKWLR